MRMAGALRVLGRCFTGGKQIPLEQWTYLACLACLTGVVDKKKSKKKKKKKSKDPAKITLPNHPVMKSNPPVLWISGVSYENWAMHQSRILEMVPGIMTSYTKKLWLIGSTVDL